MPPHRARIAATTTNTLEKAGKCVNTTAMSLTLTRRPSGIYRVRGTVHGIRIDQSTKTRDRAEAREIRDKLAAEIFHQKIYGRPKKQNADFTFGQAALSYLEAGRGGAYNLEIVIKAFADTELAEITQGMIDKKARAAFPHQKPSTRLRSFYAPTSAILRWAARERMMPFLPIETPRIKQGRPDWRTPKEIEELIAAARGMSGLVTFYVGTGCRASEALGLKWKDVSPNSDRITFWDTKSNYPRSVDLCTRTRAALPLRQDAEKLVWRKDNGDPWSNRHGPARKLKRLCAALQLPHSNLHTFRHTWASWHYAQNKDPMQLMRDGGWRSLTMVMRYTHMGSADLAEQVKQYNWRQFGQNLGNTLTKNNYNYRFQALTSHITIIGNDEVGSSILPCGTII